MKQVKHDHVLEDHACQISPGGSSNTSLGMLTLPTEVFGGTPEVI